MEEHFDEQILYNDNRGALYKAAYKSFIRNAIAKRLITVDKFIVEENVQDELDRICESTGIDRSLINCLKDYHNEPDYVIAPLIYLLKKLDPQFTLSTGEGKLKIVSEVADVEICSRIDGKNAIPRLFLPNERIAITTTNETIVNLGDILAVKDVTVYVIDIDTYSNNFYAYKINRDHTFFTISEGFKDRFMASLIKKVRKKGI